VEDGPPGARERDGDGVVGGELAARGGREAALRERDETRADGGVFAR
jgi:hypothetical protein